MAVTHRICFLLALPAFLTSCITFTGQTLTFRHDPKADRLYIFQNYLGIYGDKGGDGENLSKEEIRQIESVINGQRTFFFSNWLTELNIDALKKSVREMEAPSAPATRAGAAPKTPTEADWDRRTLALTKRLIEDVSIRNGEFYFHEGYLCGYQCVTINNLSKVLHAANGAISASIRKSCT
jgi:hypothetical protein